jgi:hypothetical protein
MWLKELKALDASTLNTRLLLSYVYKFLYRSDCQIRPVFGAYPDLRAKENFFHFLLEPSLLSLLRADSLGGASYGLEHRWGVFCQAPLFVTRPSWGRQSPRIL